MTKGRHGGAGWGPGLAFAALAVWVAAGAGGKPVEAAVSRERMAAGAALFHERGCVYCHGEDLGGTEKAPSLNSVGRQRTRAQMERQIREGGGGMPAFGEILPVDEVATLLDFLGSRRKPVPKGQKPWGEGAAASAAAGPGAKHDPE